MNATETVHLCEIIGALCPSQKFDRLTPDAWSMVLEDIRFTDAQQAVRAIYREQGSDAEWVRRIEADDIIREVKRLRNRRLATHPALIPPAGLSLADEQQWMRDAIKAVGDGEVVPETRGALTQRPVALAIEASTKAPVVRERKQAVAGHTITQAEIDVALAKTAAALKDAS